uniref:RHS repeat-associated core domain-containing protein n=1 Tax=Enterobacterales TaxID=91347 RepID=UPI002EDB672C
HFYYHHDHHGNLTEKDERAIRKFGSHTHHYRYDLQHRLVEYQQRQNGYIHIKSRYRYDPAGRRISKQVWKATVFHDGSCSQPELKQTVWYGWDGDRLTTTETEGTRVQTIYLPGSFTPLLRIETPAAELRKAARRTLAEKLQQEGSVTLPPELTSLLDRLELEIQQNGVSEDIRQWLAGCGLTVEQMAGQMEPVYIPDRKIHLYHCDHRGLPLALINMDGSLAWQAEYDEWGNLLHEDNPQNLQQLIRLPGQQSDEETGLYYNRHRYYDPMQGRYITQDPIGLRGGWNLYAYPLAPVMGIDPLGLDAGFGSLMGDGGAKYAANVMSMDVSMSQSGASPQDISNVNKNICIGSNSWNPGNQYIKGIVFGSSAIGIGGLGVGGAIEGGIMNGVRKMSLGCAKNVGKTVVGKNLQNQKSDLKLIISECVKGAVDSGLDEFGGFAFDTSIENLP